MQTLECYRPCTEWAYWYACLQGKHGKLLCKKARKWGKRLALRLLIGHMPKRAAQVEHVMYCSNHKD